MLMYSRQSFHPIVSRDQYTTIVFIQRTLNIDPPIHRAVLYRPLYISVYRYIILNVNPSIMLSGPFLTGMFLLFNLCSVIASKFFFYWLLPNCIELCNYNDQL